LHGYLLKINSIALRMIKNSKYFGF